MTKSDKRNVASGWRRRLVSGLAWFIAIQFFLLAPLKFYPGGVMSWPSYPEKFVRWGYPAWFSYVIGAAEILAAVLLVLPRRRFLGAVLLVLILTAAVATHIINHDSLSDSIAAPILLVLAGIVALTNWPADWREPLSLGHKDPGSGRNVPRHSTPAEGT